MSKLIVAFLLSLFSLIAFAQDQKDIVFPVKGEPIKNAIILEIGPGNSITYIKNNETSSVSAKAYVKDGVYHDLSMIKTYAAKNPVNSSTNDSLAKLTYNNHNYFFYYDQYYKAKKLQRTGIILVIVGTGAAAAGGGFFMLGNQSNDMSAIGMILPGIVLMGAGSIAAIGGLVFTTVSIGLKSTNKEYMELCRPQQTISLQLGIQENGIGARIRF